jgi:hypothetical protein
MNNNPNVNLNTPYLYHRFKHLSWGAILAGAVVGTGLSFLLNLFCVAIGLSVMTTSSDGVTALAVGGFLGLLISVIVAMFVAGMTAGYMARPLCSKRNLGIFYGFATWSVALILVAILASHMSHFVTNYTNYIYNRPDVVNVVNNNVTPAVTASTQSNPTEVTINAQKAVNNVGYGAFVVFFLFFMGALSSSFGGYCGMVCKRKHDDMECGDNMIGKNCHQPDNIDVK